MCDFCKALIVEEGPNTHRNINCVSLAERESESKKHGLQLIMGKTNSHFKIEDCKFVHDKTIETPIRYLKAVKWQNTTRPMAWTTAFEIHYCPVCGEKF